MKVVPFPGGGSASPDETWLAELEAALNGDGKGAAADSWRELRADVRALAPPMDPEFERQLGEQIAERGARAAPKQPHRRLGWLRPPSRPALAAVSALCTAMVVVLIVAPWRLADHATENLERLPSPAARTDNAGRASGTVASAPAVAANAGRALAPEDLGPASGGAASAPRRVQQLGASISLSATPAEVQTVADSVSRLAVSDGGFVQSSQVQVQQEGASRAELDLRLPSAKLSATLAALGRLAPLRAESQTLQDITNTYNTAHQRLGDVTAERQALLRALSRATTEGQIDSLRERLSHARDALAQARAALQTVSQHASTAEVEVSIVGDANSGSEGLTLHRGIHDAGRVLVVTLAVLLIAAAVLVPMALVITAITAARRAWRRHQRERVLDSPL